MAQEPNLTDRGGNEPNHGNQMTVQGGGMGANQGATPLMRAGDTHLPQQRERHTIIEKRLVTRDGTSELGRHLLSVTAAVNAYAIEKGSLILAIYGSQPGEGTSIVARELAISLSRSPTNNVLLIDGNTGKADQGRYFGSNVVDSLWAAARGAPIRTVRLTMPRGGSIDLAALQIDGAADPGEIDLRLLPQLFNRLRNVFNVIIIDCPPVLSAAGYVSASGLADSCLLVVEAARTRVPVVRRAMEEIEAAGGKLQGVVLNKRKHYIPSWLYRRL
jgi:Mrp family chromosome partitioning ATPase